MIGHWRIFYVAARHDKVITKQNVISMLLPNQFSRHCRLRQICGFSLRQHDVVASYRLQSDSDIEQTRFGGQSIDTSQSRK